MGVEGRIVGSSVMRSRKSGADSTRTSELGHHVTDVKRPLMEAYAHTPAPPLLFLE